MAFPPALPLELLRPILSHFTETQSLLRLCHVSRSFHHDAQRVLYADVALRSEDVALFCRTLTESPALAQCVRRLSIQLSNMFADMDELAQCMRSLLQLRALEISATQPHPWEKHTATLPETMLTTPWTHSRAIHILSGCSFRLKVLASVFRMANADFTAFLEQQSEIEELVSFDTTGDVVMLAEEMLPNLREFWGAVTRLEFRTEPGREKRVFRDRRMDIEVLRSPRGILDTRSL
ncbi:hypothetical protein C8F04DRAFT_1359411 [Mycena alexandri]|uniref:F-box domain-containing protein n=1 Tax=Mycena alexandri TaxID=1745969 RepID=A0AAD6SR47_9AGAR|nr:hypothetical protein C8F04DRAFT_1359411 [Mycena alexandri]